MRIFIIVYTIFLFGVNGRLVAQKPNHIWVFGDSAGLDFKVEPPSPFYSNMESFEGCASIADTSGNLLFYSNGEMIWDRTHTIMPNGFGLKGGYSCTQETLIIPKPNSCTNYFVFSNEDGTGFNATDGGLYYSEVSMLLNNGFGDIINGSKNTFLVDSTTEKLAAVTHSNGVDIWVITSKRATNQFMAFLVTESGIQSPPVLSFAGGLNDTTGAGYLKFSHDSKKLVAVHTAVGFGEVFDFNSATGIVSNSFKLPDMVPNSHFYGAEFSLDNNLLYLSAHLGNDTSYVYQINLDTLSMAITTLVVADDIISAIQMGPNGKIYIARLFHESLDVIHFPNIPGLGCQYEIAGIALLPNSHVVHGLPNPSPYSFCLPFTLGPDRIICQGESLEFKITPGEVSGCLESYIWFDGTSDTSKVFSQPGTYWIEIQNTCSSYRDSINISIDSFEVEINATICAGGSFDGYTNAGVYLDTLITNAGCSQARTLNLTVNPISHFTLEKEICSGDSFQGHIESGTYADTLSNTLGCDSIYTLILEVIDCPPIVHYNLDACRAYMNDNSHMNYSEFTPSYPQVLSCADVTATHLTRLPIAANKHSCTNGINFTPAMCVTTYNSCTYDAGNIASIIIEFVVSPAPDSIVQITQLDFYEKSPLVYNWIDGANGLNNRPRFFGIRILKNGGEIFQQKDIPTSLGWALKRFNFRDSSDFQVITQSTFRIELLAYCPIGNSADVSAWDLDELKIYGGCISSFNNNAIIEGYVLTKSGKAISEATVILSEHADYSNPKTTITNTEGYYSFDTLGKEKPYFLKAYKNDDVLNGVSAFDLVLIQKHLLGISSFETLEQYIAADANSSTTVTAIDLIDITKLLLGKLIHFPGNTSWRFGILPQDLSGSNISAFQEIKTIELLGTDRLRVDFLGIKIGDLNLDAR